MTITAATVLLLAKSCSPSVDASTALALASVESSYNPFAIGVVGDALVRQPRTRAEALATMKALDQKGLRYSVGLVQIYVENFERLGLTRETALDPCRNLQGMAVILTECFDMARRSHDDSQAALRAAISCYYSGNFQTGFDHGYVAGVVRAARAQRPSSGDDGRSWQRSPE